MFTPPHQRIVIVYVALCSIFLKPSARRRTWERNVEQFLPVGGAQELGSKIRCNIEIRDRSQLFSVVERVDGGFETTVLEPLN